MNNVRYVLYIDLAPRYCLSVMDRERKQKFAVNYQLHPVFADRGPEREFELERLDANSEDMLWLGIKKESPGTYLGAKALGLVPERVSRLDR